MKVGVSRARSSRWRLPTPGRVCRPALGWRGWASSRPSGSEPLTLVSNTDVIVVVETDHNPVCRPVYSRLLLVCGSDEEPGAGGGPGPALLPGQVWSVLQGVTSSALIPRLMLHSVRRPLMFSTIQYCKMLLWCTLTYAKLYYQMPLRKKIDFPSLFSKIEYFCFSFLHNLVYTQLLRENNITTVTVTVL